MRNRYFFAIDIMLVGLTAYLSFVLRLENFTLADGIYWETCLVFASIAVIVMPITFWRFGLYRRFWRYASTEELLLMVSATTAGTIFVSLLGFLLTRGLAVLALPRSLPFIFLMLSTLSMAGPRLAVRLWARRQLRPKDRSGFVPVLIVGAGDAGALVLRELQINPNSQLSVVGLIDDDPTKHKIRIHGVPVLGNRSRIPKLVEKHGVEQVIIAMPAAPGRVIRETTKLCEQAGARVRIVPSIYELLNGTVKVSQLRDVEIQDLLRREPVQIDLSAVRKLLQGKRVLVTGGGGSIGSELCRQVLLSEPEALIILGHGENSLFAVQHELERALETQGNRRTALKVIVADLRFGVRIQNLIEQYRPDIVFHAAAHKHVPLMEDNAAEAITNNVLGTKNLLEACERASVERFILISTDKAVNPTSMMGVSKRIAELLVQQSVNRTGKPYVVVRFGNVLGSRGSVVLTFKQQIAEGGPVTVTHPDMIRFFMLIPEAVQLVLQAATFGQGGDIFVLDMGKPVKIVDLARDMIELSGLEVGRDIDVIFTGTRPGEKLYEELFTTSENCQGTEHPKIFLATASNNIPKDAATSIERLIQAARDDDSDRLMSLLQQLVPEYQGPVTAAPTVPTMRKQLEP